MRPGLRQQQSRVVPTDGGGGGGGGQQAESDKSSVEAGSSRGFSGTHTEDSSKEEAKKRAKAQRLLPFGWSDIVAFYHKLTYANAKKFTAWLLSASMDITVSFEDLLMLMTFYVLFIEDVRVISIDKEHEGALAVANSICLFTFIAELLLTSWSKTEVTSYWPLRYKGHLFSFFFWLDVLAILSMFPDIPWIADPIGLGGISGSLSDSNRNIYKAARVARTVRLVRLVRVYRITSERRRQKQQEEELFQLVASGAITFDAYIKEQHRLRESQSLKVGAELSETITKRVIIIVLAMLVLVPVLSYSDLPRTQSFSFDLLHDYNQFGTNTSKQMSLDTFVDSYSTFDGHPYCIKLFMQPFEPDAVIWDSHSLAHLRDYEITKFDSWGDNGAYTEMWFSNHQDARVAAVDGILLTLFIMAVMLIATSTFTSDAERLVLKPIERMMAMVNKVRKDPLQPVHLDRSEGAGEFETVVLEMAIQKITGLLRVCFGEAGAKIISENLSAENQSSINPLIPGSRVYAIFGFCDIHHFEEVNEKLGKEIMTFVNTIAAIVHGEVHAWAGQSNKNLGNAFLVVWRIGEEKLLFQMMDHNAITERTNAASGKSSSSKGTTKRKELDLTRVPGIDALADRALIAYLKIIADINRSTNVLQYRKDKRLTDDGKHEFKVRMGFGLHAGWAIEGAVGSVQKVDATYLSPHVNMAARLETSSKQYGVPLLLSERVYELMSPPAKSKCRQLDIVTVKGSEVPIGIYTYDCMQEQKFVTRTRQRKDRQSFVLKRNNRGATTRQSVSVGQTSRLKSVAENSSDEEDQGSPGGKQKTGGDAAGAKYQIMGRRVLESGGSDVESGDDEAQPNNKPSNIKIISPAPAPKTSNSIGGSDGNAASMPRDTGASIATTTTSATNAAVTTTSSPADAAAANAPGDDAKDAPSDAGATNASATSSNTATSATTTPLKAPARLAPLVVKGHTTPIAGGSASSLDASSKAAAPGPGAESDSAGGSSIAAGGGAGSMEAPAPVVVKPAPAPSSPAPKASSPAPTTTTSSSSLDAVSKNTTRPAPSAAPATAAVPSAAPAAKYMKSESGEEPKFFNSGDDTADAFEKDADLLALRRHVTPQFIETFKSAVDLYIAGDWVSARPLFESANMMMLESMGGDGPCKTLLRYMAANNYDPQSISWKGYRPLTSK